ncbi:phage holin family protein [Kribbella deserti]|uniref:Phage holin family protein n=1 Tax=Kribbella deserti TaxID=1926257 RepID=A0ABV6QS77_9ACTN
MTTQHRTPQSTGDEPVGALVGQLSADVSRLVRDELQLAKLELKEKGKEAGIGLGLFGGAGTIALYGLGALITAGILGLAQAVPAWLSALIVAVVLFVVAVVAALLGKRHVAEAAPPMPEHAVEGVHSDIEALKGHHATGPHLNEKASS